MSRPQDGRNMDQSFGSGGSVRRARERAEAGITGDNQPNSIPRLPIRNPNNGLSRIQSPAILQSRDGNIRDNISRPSPTPQWPLSGPITSPASSEGSEPYRPPMGKTPPQRPPRPSRVPSILDGSRIQDHTPVFQYTPQNLRVSELSVPETPATTSSRDSSVGSIPDFPIPVTTPREPPRRSVNLGPPPSARRGNTSYYSTTSYVSPIPEESPRTRSHTSYASSAAIPESFGTLSPGLSQSGNYYEDTIAEESVYSDDADDRSLVRSASIGRKGKPSLVTTRSSERGEVVPFVLPIRPQPAAMQQPDPPSPFLGGTAYLDGSSSGSSRAPSSTKTPGVGSAVTTDNMLNAFEAASATDPSSIQKSATPKPFRLSALRRPPRLDIDAVRQAEARGSLTSLPDLIKRATRLAAMMDKGRRPASRLNDLDFPDEFYGRNLEKETSYNLEKHQSGLSDMLAAFPPPAQANSRRSMRQSTTAWPLPFAGRRSAYVGGSPADRAFNDGTPSPTVQKRGRRCCGLPLWGFILLMVALILVIAAAIIVPLEFFVIQKRTPTAGSAQPEVSNCQAQLKCENGGTNVVIDGVCSCICSNGFTGTNCTVSSAQGCTTTSLSSTDSTLRNVTLGSSIPRLVQQGQMNFSLPLSATSILSKFNAANLSCVAENALVTFEGQSSRVANAAVAGPNLASGPQRAENAIPVTVTILPNVAITLTLNNPAVTGDVSIVISTLTEPLTNSGSFSTLLRTTIRNSASSTLATATPTETQQTTATGTTSSPPTATGTAPPSSTFVVTDQVIDFGRVAVLFVLQSQNLENAASAQLALQKFFTSALSTTGVTAEQARSVSIGAGNTINMVNFLVNLRA